HCARNIAGEKVDRRQVLDRRISVARHAATEAVLVHIVKQAANVSANEIGLERPRGVGVAGYRGEVWEVAVEHPLIAERGCGLDGLAIEIEFAIPKGLKIEAGGGDDKVGHQFAPRTQFETIVGKGFDLVRYQRDAALPDGLKKIAIGCKAKSLLP